MIDRHHESVLVDWAMGWNWQVFFQVCRGLLAVDLISVLVRIFFGYQWVHGVPNHDQFLFKSLCPLPMIMIWLGD